MLNGAWRREIRSEVGLGLAHRLVERADVAWIRVDLRTARERWENRQVTLGGIFYWKRARDNVDNPALR